MPKTVNMYKIIVISAAEGQFGQLFVQKLTVVKLKLSTVPSSLDYRGNSPITFLFGYDAEILPLRSNIV